MKNLRILIFGRVQGVFFRASAFDEAIRLGVRGFVCNLSDGSVCLEAEGSEALLTSLIEWCQKGPDRAIVEEVKVVEGQIKHYSQFEIKR